MATTKEQLPGPREMTYTPNTPFNPAILNHFNATIGEKPEHITSEYGETAETYRWDFPKHPNWAQNWINRIDLMLDGTVVLYGQNVFHYPLCDTHEAALPIAFSKISAEEISHVITIESVPEQGMKNIYTIPVRAHFSVRQVGVDEQKQNYHHIEGAKLTPFDREGV